MNFLNNAIAQVSELFRSMTPGARITSGLLLAVVIASFGYLFKQNSAGPDAYLFGGEPLSDSDLTNIEMAIASKQLSGAVREGNRIRVPAGQKAAYLAAIADAGAQPSNFNTILERAVNKAGPWESREAYRERMKVARQQQLSEIIRAMTWVDAAVVIYDEQEARGLTGKKQVTASVNVQPKPGESLDPRRRNMLQKFVASAVMGLKSESVIVTDLGDGSIAGSGGGNMDPSMFDDPYYQKRVAYEQYKRESILRILSDIPNVQVEVNAELDDTASKTSSVALRNDKSRVTVRESTATEKNVQSGADGGAQPGPAINSATANNLPAAPQRQSQNELNNSTEQTEYLPGSDLTTTTTQGFTPKEVLATVKIPSKYFEDVWRKNHPDDTNPPSPEQLKLIEDNVIARVTNMVEPLLVKSADRLSDTFKRVKVVPLDTLPAPAITPPSMASLAMAWTGQYWNSMAMLGVAMFSLLVLRSVVKSGPANNSPGAAPSAPALALANEETGKQDEPAGDEPADDRPRLRLKKGTSLKDDLVDIVREDPDAAADILRSWIGKAG